MHKRNCDRSFSDRRRHALDVSGPHVPDRKYSRPARLEKMGRTRERPTGADQVFLRQIRSRLDETLSIQNYTTIQPARARRGPCHDKYMPDVAALACSRLAILPTHALQMIAAIRAAAAVAGLVSRVV